MNCWILRAAVVIFLWEMSCSNSIRMSPAGHRVARSTNSSRDEREHVDVNPPAANSCVNVSNSEDNETTAEPAVEVDESKFRKEFLTCAKSPVECQYYQILPNKSVFVPLYNRLFDTADHTIVKQVLYICSDFLEESIDDKKFSSALDTVSIVGTSISLVCILLHMAMFLSFRKLRNLPGYCLFSLCVALLAAYVLTLLSYFHYSGAKDVDCTAVGGMKAYFFLASLFWMNVMSYDIWRSLRMATAKLRLTGDRPMLVRYAMYSAYSWGFPLAIVLVGVIVDSSPGSDEKYRFTIERGSCWFYYRQALLVYFVVPLVVLLVLNSVLFVWSFCMIVGASLNTAENRADLWSRFLVCVRLAVVMGLMWFFGILAPLTEQSWLWYLYVLCNVLQGVFIFFSFTFTEKTRHECKKAIQGKKSSVIPTQTSSQQSTSV
ncbi:g_PROTEIN_RECEP_F2_4 domain-containing protein [Caerostris darwini]|uniref:G_PROTEIN_RECEP_F2_4 domain-containing protein n=1 Tax=Caerostris darwini TaxID=1538125 RepID=A0AAV4MRP5_9ARAC|nr:g_PROTEIN_RECEP_F2_4 domain-containing protein [Caerostris darwini]